MEIIYTHLFYLFLQVLSYINSSYGIYNKYLNGLTQLWKLLQQKNSVKVELWSFFNFPVAIHCYIPLPTLQGFLVFSCNSIVQLFHYSFSSFTFSVLTYICF